MSEMIERVRAALLEAADRYAKDGRDRDLYRDMACAAVAAMRVPTEAMLAAGKKEVAFVSRTEDVYRSMIDTALCVSDEHRHGEDRAAG